MNFRATDDGLKLFFGDVPVFVDIKAYIMTEEDEKTYLDFKCSDKMSAQFEKTDINASLCVSLVQVNSSYSVRISAHYNPDTYYEKKENIHFYEEHAAGIELLPSESFDFSGIYKRGEFWARPFFAKSGAGVPETAQAIMMPYSKFNLFLAALCDKDFKGNFEGCKNGKINLYVWDNCRSNDCDTAAAVIAAGGKWDTLIENTIADGFIATGRKPLMRKDKKLPPILNWFGWCSWDALALDVSHDTLLEKLQEFKDKKIPAKWIMIDDMWGHVKNNKLGVNSTRELYDFEADPIRFPKGLRGAVSDIKKKFGVKVGLWHPTTGYWYGIDPHGNIVRDKKYRDLLYWSQQGQLVHSFEKEKIEKYYLRQHKFYKKCGIDFVKIDNQSCPRRYSKRVMSIGEASANMHCAIEKAADKFYGGQLINCMGMPIENFWNRRSAVSRMSCDYLPDSTERFNLLVQQNAFNSMVQGTVYYGDYDMWWTYDSQAQKNAAIHAICGGPVYVSDQIGKTDFEVIKPLIFDDGRVIRMENPARPTADCLFVNSQQSGKPFKIYNNSERGGVVIAYNIDEENRAVTGSICATDAGLSADSTYCVYDRINGTASVIKGNEPITVELADNSCFKVLLFVPVTNGAIIGIKEKYICFELLRDARALCDGTLLLYGVKSVLKNGKRVKTVALGGELYKIPVKSGEEIKLCPQ